MYVLHWWLCKTAAAEVWADFLAVFLFWESVNESLHNSITWSCSYCEASEKAAERTEQVWARLTHTEKDPQKILTMLWQIVVLV